MADAKKSAEAVKKIQEIQRAIVNHKANISRIEYDKSNKIKSFDQWVELDLRYIDNWSLLLDLEILLKTVPVVVLGFGAR